MADSEKKTSEPQGNEGNDNDQQQPTVEEQLAQLQTKVEELTEHSRKWEKRAKDNFEKAQKYDELAESQKTDEQRLADLEAKLADAEKRANDAELAVVRFRVAAKHGISDEDAELFLNGADEDTIVKQAERFSERAASDKKQPPKPNPAQGKRGESGPTSTAELFAQTVEGLF